MENTLLVMCLVSCVAFFGLLRVLLKNNDNNAAWHRLESQLDSVLKELNFLRAQKTPAQSPERKKLTPHDIIKKGFQTGAEFSSDKESNSLIDNVYSAYVILQEKGVIYMWINDVRHELRKDNEQ